MSASEALQKAVFDALVADVGVGAIVGDRIYDRMPSDGDYPCLTFGPSQALPDDYYCIVARTETLQIDCWSQDQGRLRPVRKLADAVKRALHNARLDLDVHALSELQVGQMRAFLDPDGVTGHGVVVLEAEIEERSA